LRFWLIGAQSSGENGLIVEKRSVRPKAFRRKARFESICCLRIFTAKGKNEKSGDNSDWNNSPFAERSHKVPMSILLKNEIEAISFQSYCLSLESLLMTRVGRVTQFVRFIGFTVSILEFESSFEGSVVSVSVEVVPSCSTGFFLDSPVPSCLPLFHTLPLPIHTLHFYTLIHKPYHIRTS